MYFVLSGLPQAWCDTGIRFSVCSDICPSTFATTLASTLLSGSVTLKSFEMLWQNLVQIQSFIRQCTQNKYLNSTYTFYGIMPLCKFHCHMVLPRRNTAFGGIPLKPIGIQMIKHVEIFLGGGDFSVLSPG